MSNAASRTRRGDGFPTSAAADQDGGQQQRQQEQQMIDAAQNMPDAGVKIFDEGARTRRGENGERRRRCCAAEHSRLHGGAGRRVSKPRCEGSMPSMTPFGCSCWRLSDFSLAEQCLWWIGPFR
jgi:hypothetical protein